MKKNNSLEQRKVLFLKYSKNLRNLILDQKWENNEIWSLAVKQFLYMCPICQRLFSHHFVEGTDPSLTLEHVPPKSLGGKVKILTCKKCNNESGHSSDHSVKSYLDIKPFFDGEINSSYQAKFIVDSKHIKGHISLKDDNTFFLTYNEKSNPFHIKDILNYMASPSGSLKFRISIPSEHNFKLGLLKMAYLECFALWGYSFITHKNTRIMRDIFLKQDNELKPIVLQDTFTDSLYVGLNYLKEPIQYSNFIYVLEFKIREKRKYFGVVIPQLGEQGLKNYINFLNHTGDMPIEITNFDESNFTQSEFEKLYGYYSMTQHCNSTAV